MTYSILFAVVIIMIGIALAQMWHDYRHSPEFPSRKWRTCRHGWDPRECPHCQRKETP